MEDLELKPATGSRPSLAGALSSIVLILLLLYIGRVFFITLFSAVLLAFILEPLVSLGMRLKLPRGAASFVACSLMLIVLYLAGLGLWSQATGIWRDLPRYSQRVADIVDSATSNIQGFEKNLQDLLVPKRIRDAQLAAEKAKQEQAAVKKSKRRPEPEPVMPPAVQEVRIQQERSPIVSAVLENYAQFTDALLMASFVPFLVYFFLSWRDHLRNAILNVLSGDHQDIFRSAWDGVAEIARAYVVGNFLLGVIISIATALFFWFINVPYWQVVGPLSGFLSLVPYLGLPLALIPPLLAALPVYSTIAAYVVIAAVVGVIHVFALNLLYPKVVGARVHLNPLVVTVALMLWYLLWGGAGLVFAIPITAGLKAVCDKVPSLRAIGAVLGD
jgi:predicted PurR-regulated permease PerM